MKGDPLHPSAVRPMESESEPDTHGEDARPFWLRLLLSIRPTASVEIDKKTGKPIETVGVKVGTDF